MNMKQTFQKITDAITRPFKRADDDDEGEPQNYLELETQKDQPASESNKIVVRTFSIEDFQDIKPILDAIREGYTIALVDVKPIRSKDVIELKRTVNKLKKTVEAIEGDIAAFGDDWIVVTPQFAKIYRPDSATSAPAKKKNVDDFTDMM
ncbi:MAG: cell division protein SepF [Candidatus Woesearchaeota archaeon]